MNEIGKLITKFRKENNLTQKELADKLGVSNTAVSKWECGNNLPDITMLKPLSEILNVDVLTLLNMQEETVLEQNFRKRRYKKKFNLIVLVCFILINIILILLHYYIVNNKGNDIKCEDNGVEVYHIFDDEEIIVDGYMILNKNNSTTLINSIVLKDEFIGTKNELMARKINFTIYVNGFSIYNYFFDSEKTRETKINELISQIEFINYNFDYNINLEKNIIKEAEIKIELYGKDGLISTLDYVVNINNILYE